MLSYNEGRGAKLQTHRLKERSDVLEFRLQCNAFALQHSHVTAQLLSRTALLLQRQLQLLATQNTL